MLFWLLRAPQEEEEFISDTVEGPRAPRVTLALSSWAVHESGGKDLGAPQLGDYW